MKELRKKQRNVDIEREIAILIVILGYSFCSSDAPLK